MIFAQTALPGAHVIDLEPRRDARGFFARTFCAREFEAHGLAPVGVQCNVSFNHESGTLRGMHYQIAPALEAKLIRCTRGAIFDVVVDLRPESESYLRHIGVELSESNRRALYVPPLFAHGYLTLTPGAEVSYQFGHPYAPECERGLRFDDPALGIAWPIPPRVISDKDRAWPLLRAEPARMPAAAVSPAA